MLTERTKNEAANELRVAADAVERIDDGGEIAGLPDHLARLGDALRAAGGAYETAASRVVPAAQPLDRGIAFRYRRAAATWPAAPRRRMSGSPPRSRACTRPRMPRG